MVVNSEPVELDGAVVVDDLQVNERRLEKTLTVVDALAVVVGCPRIYLQASFPIF